MSQAVTAAPSVDSNTALMSFIERASRDDTFDVQKFGELLRLQRDVAHDQAKRAFNQAMAATQAEMQSVVRNAKNSHLNSKYAKLEAIDAALRPVYTQHGFSVRFGSAPAPHEGWMRITCTVAHDGGYFEENYLDSPVTTTGSQGGRMAMTPVQAIGSTVTYLRRYLLSMVMNVVLADDDDDGEAMRGGGTTTPPPPKPYRAERFYREPVDSTPDPLLEPDGPKWLINLEVALANAQTQQEVVVIGGHPSVTTAIAPTTTAVPDDIKRHINKLLANAFGRFAAPDTGEVHIAGEEKLASG
jgi:hypothetical protein